MTAISKLRFALLAFVVAFLMSVGGLAQAGPSDSATTADGEETRSADFSQWDDDDDDEEEDDDDEW